MPGKTEFQRVQPLNAQLFVLIYRLLGGRGGSGEGDHSSPTECKRETKTDCRMKEGGGGGGIIRILQSFMGDRVNCIVTQPNSFDSFPIPTPQAINNEQPLGIPPCD